MFGTLIKLLCLGAVAVSGNILYLPQPQPILVLPQPKTLRTHVLDALQDCEHTCAQENHQISAIAWADSHGAKTLANLCTARCMHQQMGELEESQNAAWADCQRNFLKPLWECEDQCGHRLDNTLSYDERIKIGACKGRCQNSFWKE